MATHPPAARERRVRLVTGTSPASPDGIVLSSVSPRFTEWLPELLTKLRPHTERAVRAHAETGTRPWHVAERLLDRTLPDRHTTETTWRDDVAEAVAYTQAVAELALKYPESTSDTRSEYHDRRLETLRDTVEAVGTGRGAVNAGLGALAKGPVALHRELDERPTTVTLLLDGTAWTELGDRRTGVRALATIAVLAAGFDVRVVASPALQDHLVRRYPRWSETHLGLTGGRDGSHTLRHPDCTPRETPDTHPAWDALDGLERTPGKRRLLGNLATERERTYRDLAEDHAIAVEAGTVSRYVLDLEARGLVTVNRHRTHNTVQLTSMGETAVDRFLTPEFELLHPDQQRLDASLTGTPHATTSTVSPRRPTQGAAKTPSTEEWLADTGTPEETGEYVQWLDSSNNVGTCHDRFAAVARDDGVTLVDDRLQAFDDGRVAYLSHEGGEAGVILQWGGPLATLGRLASALLSEKALSKILTPSRFGREFTGVHGGDLSEPGHVLRRGGQVGWYSEAEEEYAEWRSRIAGVRDRHLARVADLVDSDDTAARAELFEDLHGLVASATHLYHAAGIDLTTTLRVPDTEMLARSDRRLRDFLDFLRHTVPKQSVYGIHSGYRMLFEKRPEKLRRRLSYEVEEGSQMDLTTSWVLAGPTMTALHDRIDAALSSTADDVRDAIADGDETAPALSIPVVDGTTYPAIRRLIDEFAASHDVEWAASERQRLVRLCLASFGPSDKEDGACPYDVRESLQTALQNNGPALSVGDIERAAATLPPGRFRPDLPPTATKLYAALLRTEEPLGRTELLDEAGISPSSYDRRIADVRELAGVSAVTDDGRRKWVAKEGISQRGVSRSPRSTECCLASSGDTRIFTTLVRRRMERGSSLLSVGVATEHFTNRLCGGFEAFSVFHENPACHTGIPSRSVAQSYSFSAVFTTDSRSARWSHSLAISRRTSASSGSSMSAILARSSLGDSTLYSVSHSPICVCIDSRESASSSWSYSR
ncbi:plasmid replication protein RepH [Halorubrum gandharaense]